MAFNDSKYLDVNYFFALKSFPGKVKIHEEIKINDG